MRAVRPTSTRTLHDNKTVRASGVTIKDASDADMSGNYTIGYTDNLTSTINKAGPRP